MPQVIDIWAYLLDDAFPADMHIRLVTLLNELFDPTKGVSEVMRRQNK